VILREFARLMVVVDVAPFIYSALYVQLPIG